ncbi:uncharacterized protein LOC115376073 isoform X1 [Myripristis murdjan]|uniref:uncharacterized protein LOC115376073 isoform X1 n=1 Tax=Myripristis murdjan TaxID=586833 RepID=UPI00117627A8|nr:uncharacterized protein LOC115376073 isoform X1 [Myripristis murdjan]
MSSSAAQEVKNLTSTEGGSITLPDPVLTLGFLLYGKSNIAVVINSEIKLTEESFRNRVFWDKNTGLFTIIGLQRNDSGSYTVDSKTKGVLTSYRLTVYVMSSSAAQEVKNLTSTEGGSITLPDPILKLGFLLYGGSNIAVVMNSEISVLEESFRNRVFWDKNTGLFTIRGLQRNDSGIYSIDSKPEGVKKYQLTVYEPVPEPGVNRSSVSAESCTLLCFVKKSEATTLSWYRGEEILNQSRTAASLPLTVHKHNFSSSYRCEAANPAENKSFLVNPTVSCSENISDRSTSESSRPTSWLFIIPMVVFLSVAVLLVIWMCFKKEGEKE